MSIEAEKMPLIGLKVTIMDADVWDALDKLGVGEEILDEVLELLKWIPPADRVRHLEIMFPDEE